MSIKLGNTDINKLCLGNTDINKMYLGDNLILGNSSTTFVDLSPSITTPAPNEANSYGSAFDSEWRENGATRGIVTSPVLNGIYSLSATGARYALLNYRPAISYFEVGKRYRMIFNIYSPEISTKIHITAGFINFANGSNGTEQVEVGDVGNVNEWVQMVVEGEFEGTLPLINFHPRNNTGDVVTAYMDSLTIEEL